MNENKVNNDENFNEEIEIFSLHFKQSLLDLISRNVSSPLLDPPYIAISMITLFFEQALIMSVQFADWAGRDSKEIFREFYDASIENLDQYKEKYEEFKRSVERENER